MGTFNSPEPLKKQTKPGLQNAAKLALGIKLSKPETKNVPMKQVNPARSMPRNQYDSTKDQFIDQVAPPVNKGF